MAAASAQLVLETIVKGTENAIAKVRSMEGAVTSATNKMRSIGRTMTATLTLPIVALGTVAVQEAAKTEGAMAKFEAVFKEGSDEMLGFVQDLRKEMPTATQDIIAMASGTQDLLVPMGLARDEAQDMTKGFLDLSNKIAAFNDVSPEQVLEAMKSGLVGSSEPLRQFGIDARVAALETVALEEGLIAAGTSFADLDPQTRSQVQAQALLAQITNQSSDAINGFAENQDTAVRTMQNANATFDEAKAALGEALLPIVTKLTEKITELLEWFNNLSDGQRETIVVILGVIAVIGPLLVGIAAVSSALLFLAANPVVLIIGAIIALIVIIVLLIKNWDAVKAKVIEVWDKIVAKLKVVFDAIKIRVMDFIINVIEYFVNSWISFRDRVNAIITAIKDFIIGIFTAISDFINNVIANIKSFFVGGWESIKATTVAKFSAIKEAITTAVNNIKEKFTSFFSNIKSAWQDFWDGLRGITDGFIEGLKSGINNLIGRISAIIGKLIELKNKAADALGFGGGGGLSGARAAGGPVGAGKTYMVGENGPEYFTPTVSGQIIPNHKLSSGGGNVNVVLNINTMIGEPEYAERLKDGIVNELANSIAF